MTVIRNQNPRAMRLCTARRRHTWNIVLSYKGPAAHTHSHTHIYSQQQKRAHTLKITLHFSFVCRVICWLLSLVAHLPTPFALVFIGYLCVCVCTRWFVRHQAGAFVRNIVVVFGHPSVALFPQM